MVEGRKYDTYEVMLTCRPPITGGDYQYKTGLPISPLGLDINTGLLSERVNILGSVLLVFNSNADPEFITNHESCCM